MKKFILILFVALFLGLVLALSAGYAQGIEPTVEYESGGKIVKKSLSEANSSGEFVVGRNTGSYGIQMLPGCSAMAIRT